MTTSTPPAWAWLEEKYVPVPPPVAKESLTTDPCPDCGGSHKPWVLCHEYGQMREEALSPCGDHVSCSECIDLGEDCDGVHSVRETPTKLRVGARNEHQNETTAPADSFHESSTFPHGDNSADVKVETCPECGTVTDIEYGDEGGNHGPNACTRCGFSPCECDGDTVDIEYGQDPGQFHAPTLAKPLHLRSKTADRIADRDPDMEWDGPPLSLTSQLRLYGLRVDGVLDRLRLDLDDPAFRDRIVALGARRLVDGYPTFGDAMYHWTARRRGQEGDEEVADRAVYGTSGPIE